MSDARVITLLASDGEEFRVARHVACASVTIGNMLEDIGGDIDEAIPLPNMSASVLRSVLQYCEHHAAAANAPGAKTPDAPLPWDRQF